MPLRYNGKNITFARSLRKNATPQENRLWYRFLRGYRVRFQRQRPIGEFIADFYCHRARLVIEVDGSQHFSEEGEKYDAFVQSGWRSTICKSSALPTVRSTKIFTASVNTSILW